METELLDPLAAAELSGNADAIQRAVSGLSLYYCVTNQFSAAAPYWRRGGDLLERQIGPDHRELGTYLQSMAEMCLIPARLHEEARATLQRAHKIYSAHFRHDADYILEVERLLRELG